MRRRTEKKRAARAVRDERLFYKWLHGLHTRWAARAMAVEFGVVLP